VDCCFQNLSSLFQQAFGFLIDKNRNMKPVIASQRKQDGLEHMDCNDLPQCNSLDNLHANDPDHQNAVSRARAALRSRFWLAVDCGRPPFCAA
jgi:hypothetical protein